MKKSSKCQIFSFEQAKLPLLPLQISCATNGSLDNPFLEQIFRYPEKLPNGYTREFVLEALVLVLDNNYGYFNGQYFRQTKGTATGIKSAPTYADLTMGLPRGKVILYSKI